MGTRRVARKVIPALLAHLHRRIQRAQRQGIRTKRYVLGLPLLLIALVSTGCLGGGPPPGQILGERHSYIAKHGTDEILAEFDAYLTVNTSTREVEANPHIVLQKYGQGQLSAACYYELTATQSPGGTYVFDNPGHTYEACVPGGTPQPQPESCFNMTCSGSWVGKATMSAILPNDWTWSIPSGESPEFCRLSSANGSLTNNEITCTYEGNPVQI